MKRVNVKGLLSVAQLEALKAEMAKIERVDPCSHVFKRMREHVEALPSPILCQFIGHHVKWLETLAVTALRVRGELPKEAGVLHAVEVILRNAEKSLEVQSA